MSTVQTVEIEGEIVGLLSLEPASRGLRFYSGVAPYDLLDGSQFARSRDALEAARRIRSAALRHRHRSTPMEKAP